MADLLSDDTDHTVNTIQKERVDCSWLLFFQHEIYCFKAYETTALGVLQILKSCKKLRCIIN